MKDGKGDLVTDSHSILAGWRNHVTQLFNVHGVNDVWQTELIEAGGRTIRSDIHKLIHCIWN